jgi:hypothetical protein
VFAALQPATPSKPPPRKKRKQPTCCGTTADIAGCAPAVDGRARTAARHLYAHDPVIAGAPRLAKTAAILGHDSGADDRQLQLGRDQAQVPVPLVVGGDSFFKHPGAQQLRRYAMNGAVADWFSVERLQLARQLGQERGSTAWCERAT